MSILKTENLVKIYGESDNEVRALNDVSIDIKNGELGTSRSGKSTLLNMLDGLDSQISGEPIIDGGI